MAVRVPDANIPFVTSSAVIKKKIRSRFILFVIAITKNEIAAAAA